MVINAKNFINRSEAIPESDEREMREKLDSDESVSFVYTAPITGMSNERNFMAVGLLLKSQQEEIMNLVDWSGDEPTIDTNDLDDANIPRAVLCSNSDDGQIINVTDEQHRLADPGDDVRVKVQLNEDQDGNIYLNGRVLEVFVNERETEEIQFEAEHQPEEVPSASE